MRRISSSAGLAPVATFLLLATGIYNFLGIMNQVKADGEKLEPTYHMLFGIKMLLGLLVSCRGMGMCRCRIRRGR